MQPSPPHNAKMHLTSSAMGQKRQSSPVMQNCNRRFYPTGHISFQILNYSGVPSKATLPRKNATTSLAQLNGNAPNAHVSVNRARSPPPASPSARTASPPAPHRWAWSAPCPALWAEAAQHQPRKKDEQQVTRRTLRMWSALCLSGRELRSSSSSSRSSNSSQKT
eukprot:1139858-Pelagomonas_calceolata.AAC.15